MLPNDEIVLKKIKKLASDGKLVISTHALQKHVEFKKNVIIKEEFKPSRQTIRNALKRLEKENLIKWDTKDRRMSEITIK